MSMHVKPSKNNDIFHIEYLIILLKYSNNSLK